MAECEKTRRCGIHCIAPGCTNYYYNKVKGVHYHRLPLKNRSLLKKWLQMLKRADPPVNAHSRVCSKHFLQSDYIPGGKFAESGEYLSVLTSRLKPDAFPSVFDFTGYSSGKTDCPSQRTPKSSARLDRLSNRNSRKVGTYYKCFKCFTCNLEYQVHVNLNFKIALVCR